MQVTEPEIRSPDDSGHTPPEPPPSPGLSSSAPYPSRSSGNFNNKLAQPFIPISSSTDTSSNKPTWLQQLKRQNSERREDVELAPILGKAPVSPLAEEKPEEAKPVRPVVEQHSEPEPKIPKLKPVDTPKPDPEPERKPEPKPEPEKKPEPKPEPKREPEPEPEPKDQPDSDSDRPSSITFSDTPSIIPDPKPDPVKMAASYSSAFIIPDADDITIVPNDPEPEPDYPEPPVLTSSDKEDEQEEERDHVEEMDTHSQTTDYKHEIGDLAKSLDHLSTRFGQFLDTHSPPGSGIMMSPMGLTRNPSLRGSSRGNASDWYKLGPGKNQGVISHTDKESLVEKQDDENEEAALDERGNWGNHFEFILSCLGYAVGLGNVWRFPYLCYRNGGGVFFVPYFIMLFLVGIPIFFLELSLGQFTSSSPLTAWKFAPILGGVGIGMCLVSALVCIYYNMIIAYAFFYLFASFTSELPWGSCFNWWNDELCWSRLPNVSCNMTYNMKHVNGTCYNISTQVRTGIYNSSLAEENGIVRQTASQQYWDNYVLDISDGIENMGGVRWELFLVLLIAWFVVFICLSKGIKTSGKAVYFTAIFPYVVLLSLVIRGVTLEGAGNGISFYLNADISRLGDARIWIDAANQIFFSLSDCFGGLITLASYNNFHRNTFRDTLLVSLGNCFTSIFAGFAVFSFLGYLAHELDISVDKVAKGGVDLAFVVYPEAIMRMPAAPTFWSIVFFLMIITLGLDTMFALVETITSSLLDMFPDKLRRRKTLLVAVICIVLFILGISLTTRGGIYMLQLMDSYGGAWAMLIIALVESLGITWIYGPKNFVRDIQTMVGDTYFCGPIMYYWVAAWGVITPLLISGVMIFGWVDFKPASYGDYIFPPWADGLGLLMTSFIIIFIPINAVYVICKAKGTFLQRLWTVTSPTYDWGPALTKNRALVAEYRTDYVVNVKQYEREMRRQPHDSAGVSTLENGTQYTNPSFNPSHVA